MPKNNFELRWKIPIKCFLYVSVVRARFWTEGKQHNYSNVGSQVHIKQEEKSAHNSDEIFIF